MSLLSSASVWDSGTNNAPPKKRVSTMKNIIQSASTRQFVPSSSSAQYSNYLEGEENSHNEGILGQNSAPPPNGTMLEEFTTNQKNSDYVTSLVNKLTIDNGGNNLADFTPLTPAVNSRQTAPIYSSTLAADTNKPVQEPLMRQYSSADNMPSRPEESSRYSNYRQAYIAPATSYGKDLPSYAKSLRGEEDRVMEKINYMIHLLEEQRMEKTNHVVEEFLLYTLLGVFMIYIVDGFSRAGKYHR